MIVNTQSQSVMSAELPFLCAPVPLFPSPIAPPSHCSTVPLRPVRLFPCPIVPESSRVSVSVCLRPIASLSHCAPVPLFHRPIVVPLSHRVSVPVCLSPIVTPFHYAPVPIASPSHCFPVPLRPCPIVLPSYCSPVPLFARTIAPPFRCAPVPNPNPIMGRTGAQWDGNTLGRGYNGRKRTGMGRQCDGGTMGGPLSGDLTKISVRYLMNPKSPHHEQNSC